ncbi:MAG TPA: CzcE family metal-binding protein [Burkholderiales bacterium]|jgi:hypothetical protein|nr:CzcE family metal-binding protein [Burkholderiales bacterium]
MKLLAPTLAALALSAFSLAATATVTEADVLGHAAQLAAAQRTIVINAKTKWVNVKHGETVRFVAGGQEFTWDFDGMSSSFELNRVAPAGALGRKVTAYISPNDQDISSNG